jgi:ferredoxin
MTYQIRITAPSARVLDAEARDDETVLDAEARDDETVLDAARACPVDAITLIDQYHEQIWPA